MSKPETSHEHWMALALEQGKKAELRGEVPVGAIVVRDETLISKGFNCPISTCDPTAHAEIQALRQAALSENNYRLSGSTLYVTIEPCAMCIGAIIHARVSTVVFGAREPKAGALKSHFEIAKAAQFNHQVEVIEGILEQECRALIQSFFKSKRTKA
ncbi:MAG: tRNA adenosine(34) deaminase TadA [Pseudohongiellaceae bacterium]